MNGTYGFSQPQLSAPAGGAAFDKGSGKRVFGGRGFSLSAGVLNNICNLMPFENVRGDNPYNRMYRSIFYTGFPGPGEDCNICQGLPRIVLSPEAYLNLIDIQY